jgi:hypothetical protein
MQTRRDNFGAAVIGNKLYVVSDLAPFAISGFRRRFAPPKPTFTVRALRARTVNAKGARSELSVDGPEMLMVLWLTAL